jgi:hypothetical protein
MLLKSVLFSLVAFTTLASLPVRAMPDRIGNGGGVWVCEDAAHTMYDIMFMDVFEARREYQLNLPETQVAPADLVQTQKAWIQQFLKDPHTLIKNIEYVEKNVTWIDDVINLIPDGANKISPHPSTCKQGDWVPVQLVNFTDDFRVLVRRELFDSPMMSNLEKAAVYLHEGIYSYLRTEFGDTTSVRARAIVGFLLSDLGDADKLARIQKVLDQKEPAPAPTPAGSFICGIKPDTYTALYIHEAATAEAAKKAVIQDCIDGENPFSHFLGPGFPGVPSAPGGTPPEAPPGFPGFPGGGGFPGGDFTPARNCKENKVLCEAVTSSAKTKTCTLTSRFINTQVYTGTGRTSLEAQKESITACLAREGSESTCYDASNMNCQ